MNLQPSMLQLTLSSILDVVIYDLMCRLKVQEALRQMEEEEKVEKAKREVEV